MFFVDLIFALIIAVLMVALFAILFQIRGPWNSLLWFFVIVLLATWAGGVWLAPMGPPVGEFYWLPFLVVGLVIALLLAAATIPLPREESTVELVDPKERRAKRWAAGTALTIFFWVLILLLLAAIFMRYML
ncbi:MAG: hypothetical protein K9L59_12580 [Desulfobacterales bacterium]|nr:hypothetical protein [Desulfobacterales bacterium]MCF8080005.1 hypothetical protein [Desulfobacterales bacterium]